MIRASEDLGCCGSKYLLLGLLHAPLTKSSAPLCRGPWFQIYRNFDLSFGFGGSFAYVKIMWHLYFDIAVLFLGR